MMRTKVLSPREIEIVLEGHLANEDMSDFQRLLDDALRGGYETIAFDLLRCESLDSWAVGKILKFRQLCELSGKRLVMRHCNPRIREMATMTRLDALIKFED